MNRPSASRDVAAQMVDAGRAFLESLDQQQHELATFPFPSNERHRWFYVPEDHGGLPISMMKPKQQRLALRLVATGLSQAGYVTVSTIMGLENVLDELEGWTRTFNRERFRDPGLYYLTIFGVPGESPWSWRFGGHHVSIHYLLLDGDVRAYTPCFLGAHPASSPLLGPHRLRPLGGAEDLGRALIRGLDDGQRVAAVVSKNPPLDIVGANRPNLSDGDLPLRLDEIWRDTPSGELGQFLATEQRNAEESANLGPEDLEAVRLTREPKGISGADLRADQQEQLRALLDTYVARIPDRLARREAERYAKDRIHNLSFAWAGGLEPGEPHYYRVQGPDLVVEYDNTQGGSNHVHTVWRNPDDDFGASLLAHHYATGHVAARPLGSD
jgi:hypothetical protein